MLPLHESPAMEHRWGMRVACGIQVHVFAGASELGIGRLRDVSITGAFLEVSADLLPFARLELAVIPKDNRSGAEIRRDAAVVRVARDGVGIEWCEPAARSICTLLGCTKLCQAKSAPSAR